MQPLQPQNTTRSRHLDQGQLGKICGYVVDLLADVRASSPMNLGGSVLKELRAEASNDL